MSPTVSENSNITGRTLLGSSDVPSRLTKDPTLDWLTRVPTKAAEKGMPNGTVKIPGDEENSVSSVPVEDAVRIRLED